MTDAGGNGSVESGSDGQQLDTRPGQYRMSDAFIESATKWITAGIVTFSVAGFVVIIVAAATDLKPLGILGFSLLGIGIVGGLLVGAVMGGLALSWIGGIAGALLTLGLVGVAVGLVLEITWMWVVGGTMLVIATLGFFAMGFARNVPMVVGGRVVNRGGGPEARAAAAERIREQLRERVRDTRPHRHRK